MSMSGLKFSKQTSTVALVFFILYAFYGLFNIPFTQYLVSLAVGGIAFGITDCYEWAAVGVLVSNLLFPILNPQAMKGYTAGGPAGPSGYEGFAVSNADPVDINKRLKGMMGQNPILGVASPMSEGFEDAGAVGSEPSASAANQQPNTTTPAPGAGAANNATPAPVANAPAVVANGTASTPAAAAVASIAGAAAGANGQGAAAPNNGAATAQGAQGFQDNGSLFKLGAVPTDAKGGYHIDAGTTVMNALSALKPDQINAMTKDTKQLIETQKSLMSMLQTFQPMLSEGKQLMDTFNTMFAPSAGASAALQTGQMMLQGGGAK
jgi:hypothetical protein